MHNVDTYTGASFSVKNRIGRMIWMIVYAVFFRYSPRPAHAWRSFLLRLFGARVGKGAHIYPGVKIWAPWNLDISKGAAVGSGAILYSQGKIIIGCKAIISQGAHICTGTHDYTKSGHPLLMGTIVIRDKAWVAAEVFVHPGVTIGEGTVIGARSVVTRDMPDWMVCAGNPCKPLKERVVVD